jgi:hypothetical protein
MIVVEAEEALHAAVEVVEALLAVPTQERVFPMTQDMQERGFSMLE